MTKYDPTQNRYLPYQKPIQWTCSTVPCEDLQCANCGKRIESGDRYPSRWIKSNYGTPYLICGTCFQKEK